MDDKRQFSIPKAEIVLLAIDDIITYSNKGTYPDEWTGEDWGGNNQ